MDRRGFLKGLGGGVAAITATAIGLRVPHEEAATVAPDSAPVVTVTGPNESRILPWPETVATDSITVTGHYASYPNSRAIHWDPEAYCDQFVEDTMDNLRLPTSFPEDGGGRQLAPLVAPCDSIAYEQWANEMRNLGAAPRRGRFLPPMTHALDRRTHDDIKPSGDFVDW